MYSKPSSSIRIFEKVVEPILTYNSEVSLAYFPMTWDLGKFSENMWNIGSEINKVILSFIRQILGVQKKPCNIAILSETGKYPIAIKVFNAIIKYWLRLHSSEKGLILEAKALNEDLYMKKGQNWNRMVDHLLTLTGVSDRPSQNQKTNSKILNDFKKNTKKLFHKWWQKKKSEGGKLDFYFTLKNSFGYENYLDNTPRHIRKSITRIRTSSHNFPIELLRYSKNKPPREERKCTICTMNEKGDELHYLLHCTNDSLKEIREEFMSKLKIQIPQFKSFSAGNIIQYCLSMADHQIQLPMAVYASKILQIYRAERGTTPKMPVITRYGRLVKKTDKLNL